METVDASGLPCRAPHHVGPVDVGKRPDVLDGASWPAATDPVRTIEKALGDEEKKVCESEIPMQEMLRKR